MVAPRQASVGGHPDAVHVANGSANRDGATHDENVLARSFPAISNARGCGGCGGGWESGGARVYRHNRGLERYARIRIVKRDPQKKGSGTR